MPTALPPALQWFPYPLGTKLSEAEARDPRCGRSDPKPTVRLAKGLEPCSGRGRLRVSERRLRGRHRPSWSAAALPPEVTAGKNCGDRYRERRRHCELRSEASP
ncbi:hypothetical protein NDU88_004060 [Pleurodeles waltl]|uniref:Uncharacterized protein n=1 Tax=Pleurodeles waltl TaxID=8319 RepID=A0AAV7T713_PLEWA|nr:hypothetical protein NDU88_004060 [Pleurodeles waltl]